MKDLRVVLYKSSITPFSWCAQGLEHDYGRVGSTLELCVERFMDGIHLNDRIGMVSRAPPTGAFYHNMWAACNDHATVYYGDFKLKFARQWEKRRINEMEESFFNLPG